MAAGGQGVNDSLLAASQPLSANPVNRTLQPHYEVRA